MRTVYALDDQQQQLEMMQMHVKAYNNRQKYEDDRWDFHTFRDPVSFVDQINDSVKFAIIDLDLKSPDINGIDVFEQVVAKSPNTICIIFSSSVDDREEFISFMSKTCRNFCSEASSRFEQLLPDPLYNKAEIFMNKDHYATSHAI